GVNYGTGAVTGIRTIVQPFTTGTLPATIRAATGGNGLFLTINITWVASNTLALNPSGGAILLGGAHADQSADVFIATAAGSRVIPNNCSWECLTPAGTIATFTTTMPAAPVDKQDLYISTTNTITTWTLLANTGQTVNGVPTTLLANTSVHYRYNLPTTTWFRLG
ncbi:MAG TPA: hypothetical protein VNX68_02570, partial [Nitrosopumilaceae archaeon]|nr:hypothetical protein [Nitrosopumilaceae archaeon]